MLIPRAKAPWPTCWRSTERPHLSHEQRRRAAFTATTETMKALGSITEALGALLGLKPTRPWTSLGPVSQWSPRRSPRRVGTSLSSAVWMIFANFRHFGALSRQDRRTQDQASMSPGKEQRK